MDPQSGSAAEDLLIQVTTLAARVAELELRVTAHADRVEVGARAGATSTAAWWAHRCRLTRAEAHRRIRLARRLLDHEGVADALAAGDIVTEQATVIVDAVDALPTDLVDHETIAQARSRLLAEARHHDAKALRVLGRRILDVVAPSVGEEHERRVLEREERDARAACRLSLSDDGEGRTHGRFTVPAVQGAMLRKALMALASPRRTERGDPRPWAERLGVGIRRVRRVLPRRQTARRRRDPGVDSGHRPARDAADRLGLCPARHRSRDLGLGGKAAGVPSRDPSRGSRRQEPGPRPGAHPAAPQQGAASRHGRPRRRLHGRRLRLATRSLHAHHDQAWSRGGATTLADGRLLCPGHHARAHDPTFTMAKLPGGKVAFHRRT